MKTAPRGNVCKNCQWWREPTLIDLIGFEAQGTWRRIILKWNTASEIDNAGFNIYRADAEDGEYVRSMLR